MPDHERRAEGSRLQREEGRAPLHRDLEDGSVRLGWGHRLEWGAGMGSIVGSQDMQKQTQTEILRNLAYD